MSRSSCSRVSCRHQLTWPQPSWTATVSSRCSTSASTSLLDNPQADAVVSLDGTIASMHSPVAPTDRSWRPRGGIVARHLSTADANTRAALYQLIMGFRSTDLIAAAAELRLADGLADRPRSSRELAERVAAHP